MLPADIREPLVSHPERASLLEVVLDLVGGGVGLPAAVVTNWVGTCDGLESCPMCKQVLGPL